MLDVLIASPGDAATGRDAVEHALHAWNDHRSEDAGFVLRPRRWEIASVPVAAAGEYAQSVINQQLVDECDIVIALFYNRLGTPTRRAASGTAEEVQRTVAAGKPVHVYFSGMPRPSQLDTRQLDALMAFKRLIEGLTKDFVSEADLASYVGPAIERDIRVIRTLTTQQLPDQPRVLPAAQAPNLGDLSVEQPASVDVFDGDDSTASEDIEPNAPVSEPPMVRQMAHCSCPGICIVICAGFSGSD
jgi:hypothetical protein